MIALLCIAFSAYISSNGMSFVVASRSDDGRFSARVRRRLVSTSNGSDSSECSDAVLRCGGKTAGVYNNCEIINPECLMTSDSGSEIEIYLTDKAKRTGVDTGWFVENIAIAIVLAILFSILLLGCAAATKRCGCRQGWCCFAGNTGYRRTSCNDDGGDTSPSPRRVVHRTVVTRQVISQKQDVLSTAEPPLAFNLSEDKADLRMLILQTQRKPARETQGQELIEGQSTFENDRETAPLRRNDFSNRAVEWERLSSLPSETKRDQLLEEERPSGLPPEPRTFILSTSPGNSSLLTVPNVLNHHDSPTAGGTVASIRSQNSYKGTEDSTILGENTLKHSLWLENQENDTEEEVQKSKWNCMR